MTISHYALLLLLAAAPPAPEPGPGSFGALRPLNSEEISVKKLPDGESMYEASIAFPADTRANEPCREIPSFIAALADDGARTALTAKLGQASFNPFTLTSPALAQEKLLPKRRLTPPSMCVSRCFTLPNDARPVSIDLHAADQSGVCATLPNDGNHSFQSERETCSDGTSWHEVVSRPALGGMWAVCAVSANSQARASRLVVRYKLMPVRQIGNSVP